jgi:hypothetical protein
MLDIFVLALYGEAGISFGSVSIKIGPYLCIFVQDILGPWHFGGSLEAHMLNKMRCPSHFIILVNRTYIAEQI